VESAHGGHISVVRLLLATGGNKYITNHARESALHCACMAGNDTAIMMLLTHNQNPTEGIGAFQHSNPLGQKKKMVRAESTARARQHSPPFAARALYLRVHCGRVASGVRVNH
jgi:ankyrin repeat protein